MMKIKKLFILLPVLLTVSCSEPEEQRFFMPTATLDAPEQVDAESGILPVSVVFSHPAEIETQVTLVLSGDAAENVNYALDSHSATIAKGTDKITFEVRLLNDNISKERLDFQILLAPGKNYSLASEKDGVRYVAVTKEIKVPFIKIMTEDKCVNPYLGPIIHLSLEANAPVKNDLTLSIVDLEGIMTEGRDFFNADGGECKASISAGETKGTINILLAKIDQSGYDKIVKFALAADNTQFVAESGYENTAVRLFDPIVDFSNILRTYAQNDGIGYQERQSIMKPDGTWEGNKVIDMMPSAEGSNYLRPLKNKYMSQWNCYSNNTGGHILMLTEFLPDLAYPAEYTIADYGASSTARAFTTCDSLFRFVADYDDPHKGTVHLDSPRTFTAFTALRSEWDGGTNPDKGWQIDSRATKGDILASSSPMLKERIDVTLIRLEGTYDLTDLQNSIVFTAWFTSESEIFMRNVDTTLYDVNREEDGSWRVKYRIYPR